MTHVACIWWVVSTKQTTGQPAVDDECSPMEHDPLRRGGDAFMALVQRRKLREHRIIRVGHGRQMTSEGLETAIRSWREAGWVVRYELLCFCGGAGAMVVYVVAPNQNLINYDARRIPLLTRTAGLDSPGSAQSIGCNRDLPTWTKLIQYPRSQKAPFLPDCPVTIEQCAWGRCVCKFVWQSARWKAEEWESRKLNWSLLVASEHSFSRSEHG